MPRGGTSISTKQRGAKTRARTLRSSKRAASKRGAGGASGKSGKSGTKTKKKKIGY